MPTALPTQGTAGQPSTQPGGLLFLQGMSQPGTVPILSSQSTPNTNTSPNAPFNPYSLSSWETSAASIPGDIASTALNLINWGITPPGYTPGGLPTEYKVLSGPVGFGPTTYWLRASRSDQTELRAHATSIN